MRSSLRGFSFLAALTLAPAVAVAAEDPTTVYTRSWTTCSAGAMRSCHSVTLQTQGNFVGSTRVGTSVLLTVRNLQGSHPVDNMAWSALSVIRLYRTGVLASTSSSPAGVTAGGATGSGSGAFSTLTSNTTWGLLRLTLASGSRIGGCAAATGAGFSTCPGTVSFSITSSEIFNADQFSELMFVAQGPSNTTVTCSTNLVRDVNNPACDAQNTTMTTTVTPEPITMALLGTGLLGVGGARLRRRSKHEA